MEHTWERPGSEGAPIILYKINDILIHIAIIIVFIS